MFIIYIRVDVLSSQHISFLLDEIININSA
jgi:hypothetical protein